MSNNNLLTVSPLEAERMLSNARRKRAKEQDGRKEVERKVKADSERQFRVIRALLKAGNSDSFFGGFNGDGAKWDKAILDNPEDWTWVRAKYGAIGIPYPDGSEYCFAPGAVFPLHLEFKDFVHKSMNGEVREVEV